MNQYEAKQDRRRERLENAAQRLESKAAAVLNVGKEHYSRDWAFITQPGHIPARARWIKKQERAFEYVRTAKLLREKLDSVGKGGISSDDPDATDKLREELAKLEALQARMKAINTAHKRFLKDAASLDKTTLSDADKARVRDYKPAYSWEPHPFPPYSTTNNNANIRRIKERIETLGKVAVRAEQEDREHDCGAYRVVEAFSENRVRVLFDGKPADAIRSTLKSNGFRWSPDAGAWQRMYSGALVQWLTEPDSYLRKQLTGV